MDKKEHINQILELVDRSRMPKSRLVDFSVLRTLLNENLPEQLIIANVVNSDSDVCPNKKTCKIIMFTSDLDICQKCNQTFNGK